MNYREKLREYNSTDFSSFIEMHGKTKNSAMQMRQMFEKMELGFQNSV